MREAPWKQFKLPNLVTFASLTVGFVGFYLALRFQSLHWLGFSLGLSSFLDIFDGKFASLFKRSELDRAFGLQIDSLVDGTVFGALPALALVTLPLLGNAVPAEHSAMTLALALFYLMCALVRLGFYNVYSAADHHDFIGLPTTLTTIFWGPLFLFTTAPLAHALMFVFLGVFMIVPLRIPRPRAPGLAVVCLLLLGFAVWNLIRALET